MIWTEHSASRAGQGSAGLGWAVQGWAVTGGVSGEDTFSRAKWTSSRWSQPSICDVATAPQKLLDKLHPTVTVLEWNINRLYTVSSCHICRISTPFWITCKRPKLLRKAGRLQLQGVSLQNWLFKLALRDRRTNIFFDLWCLVASGTVDFCVSSTSFQKKWHRLASAASDRKGGKTQYDISWFYPKKTFFFKA